MSLNIGYYENIKNNARELDGITDIDIYMLTFISKQQFSYCTLPESLPEVRFSHKYSMALVVLKPVKVWFDYLSTITESRFLFYIGLAHFQQ